MSDWEKRTDPNTQRDFWINHRTRETSWNPPTVGKPLPSGWEEKRDAQGRVFFIDHANKKTTWVDPRVASNASPNAAASRPAQFTAATPAVVEASASSHSGHSGGMTDEELARMLQEEEDDDYGDEPSSSSSMPAPASATPLAAKAMDDEELARQMAAEWEEEEENSSSANAVSPAGSGSKATKSSADRASSSASELPASSHAGPLLMRHTIQAAGWRKVYGRVHGSTFAVYPSETAKTPELEVPCQGATLSELEAKGGMFSKKGDIFRFDITPAGGSGSDAAKKKGAAAAEDTGGGKARWAVDSEAARGLFLAHVILAGAKRPTPDVLCRCMRPLLQGQASQERANGLKALADVLKQGVEDGEAGSLASALHTTGTLADVIGCLASAPGQEHAARIVFYVAGSPECQEALHAAGAVSQLLDLLTTPDDQLQTWAVAALRPLVAGNAAATTTCLENEGPFLICSLLGSTSPDVQGHALAALCTLLQTCTADDLAGLDPVQALSMVGGVADALAQADGFGAVLRAAQGSDPRVAGVAVQLLASLARLQLDGATRSLRRAGASAALVKAALAHLIRGSPREPEVQKAALAVVVRLVGLVAPGGVAHNDHGGSAADRVGAIRHVGVDPDCLTALVACVGDSRADPTLRELAAAVLEAVAAGDSGSAAPPGEGEFSAALVSAGALRQLASMVVDPALGGRSAQLDSVLNGALQGGGARAGSSSSSSNSGGMDGELATSRALSAYSLVLHGAKNPNTSMSGYNNSNSDESAAVQALRSRGIDLVAGLLHEPSIGLHRPAARCVAALARPGQPAEVVQAVCRGCGAGSGTVGVLLTRAINGLHGAAAAKMGSSAAPAPWDATAEGVALAEGLNALASLCGAGREPEGGNENGGGNSNSMWAGACSEVCAAPGDGLRRLVSVVQGRDAALDALEPSGALAVKSAAERLFGALVSHGPPSCSAALAHAGAMDVVVGAMQQQSADAAHAQLQQHYHQGGMEAYGRDSSSAYHSGHAAPPPPLSELAQGYDGGSVMGGEQQHPQQESASATSGATAARLASLRTFEVMCAAAPGDSPELARGVAAVAQLLGEDHSSSASSALLQARAVQVLRSASQSKGCHAAIVAQGCGPLVDLLLDDQAHFGDRAVDSSRLVADVLATLEAVGAANPQHAQAIVDAGGVFAIAALVGRTHEDGSADGSSAAIACLAALAQHEPCRAPILECGAATSSLLHLLASDPAPPGTLGPAAASAVAVLELLMGAGVAARHPSVAAAVAEHARVGPRLAELLGGGDRKARATAARLLYFAAAASEPGGPFWQALERANQTAAIVAVLATAALGIKAGHSREASLAGKLQEQLHVAKGACASVTALCHRTSGRSAEVVRAGGLNYLVQLASVQNLAGAATCLATVIFQTGVHRSTLADGDGAACDVLIGACISMLANNNGSNSSAGDSNSSSVDGKVTNEGKDRLAVVEVAVGILASLCTADLAAKLKQRLAVVAGVAPRLEAVKHLVSIAQVDAQAREESAQDYENGSAMSEAASNALVVLATLLAAPSDDDDDDSDEIMSGAAGAGGALELSAAEAQVVAQVSAPLLQHLAHLEADACRAAWDRPEGAGAGARLLRGRLRAVVEACAALQEGTEAMFTHSRAVALLAGVFSDRYDPLDADLGKAGSSGLQGDSHLEGQRRHRRAAAKDEAQLEAADARAASLSALRILHVLAVKLPAAAPKAMGDHGNLVSLLVAALEGTELAWAEATTIGVPYGGSGKGSSSGRRGSASGGGATARRAARAAAAAAAAAEEAAAAKAARQQDTVVDLLGADDVDEDSKKKAEAANAAAMPAGPKPVNDPAVRAACLRLLLDLATAPAQPGCGSGSPLGPSLKQRLASHRGLLAAVAAPLAAAAASPTSGDASTTAAATATATGDQVDLLFALEPAKEASSAVAGDSSSSSSQGLLEPAAGSPTASYSDLPQPFENQETFGELPDWAVASPGGGPKSAPSSSSSSSTSLPAEPPEQPPALPKLPLTAGALREQALAVRLLGELAAADETARKQVLQLPGCFDGAVALLAAHRDSLHSEALQEGSSSSNSGRYALRSALEAMRAAAARLVRNLTLSLVVAPPGSRGNMPSNDASAAAAAALALTPARLAFLHEALVAGAADNHASLGAAAAVHATEAAADCAWALRTLLAKPEAFNLTCQAPCATALVKALGRGCNTGGAGDLLPPVVGALLAVGQCLVQQPRGCSALIDAGLLAALASTFNAATDAADAAEYAASNGKAAKCGNEGGEADTTDDDSTDDDDDAEDSMVLSAACEAALTLSACAFAPAARAHADMRPALAALRGALAALLADSAASQNSNSRTNKRRASQRAVARLMLAPVADRAFSACGQASCTISRRSGHDDDVGDGDGYEAASADGLPGVHQPPSSKRQEDALPVLGDKWSKPPPVESAPLKVPGWTSGPVQGSGTSSSNHSHRHNSSSDGGNSSSKPRRTAAERAADAAAPKMQAPKPPAPPPLKVPSADAIAEFAAAAMASPPKHASSSHVLPPPNHGAAAYGAYQPEPYRGGAAASMPGYDPRGAAAAYPVQDHYAGAGHQESADEAFARRLQEEERGYGAAPAAAASPPQLHSLRGGDYSSHNSGSSSGAGMSDEEFARQLQAQIEAQERNNSSSSGGRSYNSPPQAQNSTLFAPPPPPSYGSI